MHNALAQKALQEQMSFMKPLASKPIKPVSQLNR
jgi:hypothetical protein